MILKLRSLIGVATLAPFLASPAVATDVCAALLAQGIRDTSSTQVTESRFNELKANVCNSSYDSYSKAASQAASGGFDVPGIFGISFGSANANTEYSTKWTNFCQADYNLAISNSELRTYFSTANRAVLTSFDNCVNVTSERFIRFVEPQADGNTFSITFDNKRQGNATFKVIGISLTDSTTKTVMNVLDSCDVPPPFKRAFPWDTGVSQMNTNAFSIVCRRSSDHTIVVAGTTTAGNIDPVTVKPVPSPGPTIADRVAALEANLQAANAKNDTLAKGLDDLKGTTQSTLAAIGTGENLGQHTFARGHDVTPYGCPSGQFVSAIYPNAWGSNQPDAVVADITVECRKATNQ
jgi:hypothetical protein